MLTGGGPLAWIIINAVIGTFGSITVIEERPEPMRLLFRRRLKKLGAVTVAGEVEVGAVLCGELFLLAARAALAIPRVRAVADVLAAELARVKTPSRRAAKRAKPPARV